MILSGLSEPDRLTVARNMPCLAFCHLWASDLPFDFQEIVTLAEKLKQISSPLLTFRHLSSSILNSIWGCKETFYGGAAIHLSLSAPAGLYDFIMAFIILCPALQLHTICLFHHSN